MGALFPDCPGDWHIVTPSEVEALKARVQAAMASTDAAVAACGGHLSEADRGAWTLFYASWGQLRDQSSFLGFGAAGERQMVCAMVSQLEAWQAVIRGKCGGGAIPGPNGDDIKPPAQNEWSSTAKYVAVAVVAVAAVAALAQVVPLATMFKRRAA